MSDEQQCPELPLGLSMALASDPDAMRYFANLSAVSQRAVITGTRGIGSKKELREYVSALCDPESGRLETL